MLLTSATLEKIPELAGAGCIARQSTSQTNNGKRNVRSRRHLDGVEVGLWVRYKRVNYMSTAGIDIERLDGCLVLLTLTSNDTTRALLTYFALPKWTLELPLREDCIRGRWMKFTRALEINIEYQPAEGGR